MNVVLSATLHSPLVALLFLLPNLPFLWQAGAIWAECHMQKLGNKLARPIFMEVRHEVNFTIKGIRTEKQKKGA